MTTGSADDVASQLSTAASQSRPTSMAAAPARRRRSATAFARSVEQTAVELFVDPVPRSRF